MLDLSLALFTSWIIVFFVLEITGWHAFKCQISVKLIHVVIIIVCILFSLLTSCFLFQRSLIMFTLLCRISPSMCIGVMTPMMCYEYSMDEMLWQAIPSIGESHRSSSVRHATAANDSRLNWRLKKLIDRASMLPWQWRLWTSRGRSSLWTSSFFSSCPC